MAEGKQLPKFWVKAHYVNKAERLDFVISHAIKRCKCINDLMLHLQSATLL